MAKLILEIIQSKRKSKEKVILLTEQITKNKKLFKDLVEVLKTGTDVEKGTSADVMKHVSKSNPEIVIPYIDTLVEYINYKASRVKWGVPESIGNLAKKYPKEVEITVPKLLINTKEESTVIRWCAAFALSEIAKYNSVLQKELIPKFKKFIKQEKNNGVKNIYLKTLKKLNNE